MKKYEVLSNGVKTGILTFNPELMKTIIRNSVTSIITAITNYNCKFTDNLDNILEQQVVKKH